MDFARYAGAALSRHFAPHTSKDETGF